MAENTTLETLVILVIRLIKSIIRAIYNFKFKHAFRHQVLQLLLTIKVLSELLAILSDYGHIHLVYRHYLFHFVVNADRFKHDHAKQYVFRHMIVFN